MTPGIANIVGFAGSFCIVSAFAYNNAAARPNFMAYNAINLLGAILLGLSLTVHYNLPSLVLEFVWGLVAIFGLVKAALRMTRS